MAAVSFTNVTAENLAEQLTKITKEWGIEPSKTAVTQTMLLT